MSEVLAQSVTGPAIPGAVDGAWLEALAPLTGTTGGTVVVNHGWDLDWERAGLLAAEGEHLSVRLYDDEVLIGPRWVPATSAGCAGCAEVRSRIVLAHPLVNDLASPCTWPVPRRPLLLEMLTVAAMHLADRPLRPGELYAVAVRGMRRHRVPRSFNCPICGPANSPTRPTLPATAPGGAATPGRATPIIVRPGRWRPVSCPASAQDPTRAVTSGGLLDGRALRDRLLDPRFGPIQQVARESRAPFAMSMAMMPDAPAAGFGRAATFGQADPVAFLESYERVGGFPYDVPILTDLAYQEVAGLALDPATLGQYTPEQLAHPSCLVTPSGPDTPMDWVWGHELATGEPTLVPADIGFYQYDYRFRRDRNAARRADPADRLHFFHESSSGCALGSGLEEATLHSLLELAERDAFLLAWHRAAALPSIRPASVRDPVSHLLLDLIEARGFRPWLLAATSDIDVPVVWAMAVNETRAFPATFSAAGSGADPESAVRAALWELAQLVTDRVAWSREQAEPMLEDPWLVQTIDDHIRLYTLPERRERATAVLGGPEVRLAEAFEGWPENLHMAAGGDVRGALEFVASAYARAGLDRVIVVDQSSREHRDLGLAVAKAVVPGILPMCFGHAHQRLLNLPRLAAAMAGPGTASVIPYDPHPFP